MSLRYPGRTAGDEADDRGNQEQHDRDEEDDLREFDRDTCHTAEAENGRDQCNDEKGDCPANDD